MMQNRCYLIFFLLVVVFFSVSSLRGQTTLIRGPYLQVGTSTSVIVRWKTSSPTDSQVTIGLSQGSVVKTVLMLTKTIEHEVIVDNLDPNTKYFYTIGSSLQVLQGDGNNYFITNPIQGAEHKLRFWITGDCGNNSVNQRQVRDQYLIYVGGQPTHGWLLLGDNAYSSGLETEYDENFFKQYQDDIMKHAVLWPSPGNHDYANSTYLQKSKQIPYYSLFTLPMEAEAGGVASHTESYYSYNIGNVHFIALDSYGEERNSYRLYDTLSPQVQWLKTDLELNKQTWTIAYWHHPPYTKGSHDSDAENELVDVRKNLLRILERYTVDLVLCGHSHSYERSKMMKGHYDFSSSFTEEEFVKNKSTAAYDGSSNSCPYIKYSNQNGAGIVYVVSGSSGQLGGSTSGFPHPAMFYSDRTHGGSLILEVEKNRLDLKWLSVEGIINDSFTMMKNVNTNKAIALSYGDKVELTASWIGNYEWNKKSETTRSILVSPKTDTLYVVKDKFNCLADSFKVTVNRITGGVIVAPENFGMKIFPNPSYGEFWIKLPYPGIFKIEVLDAYGKIFFTMDAGKETRFEIQDLGLKPGLYFISARDEVRQWKQKLVVIGGH